MLLCLIAAEPEAARVIQQNLSARFPNWRFETATDAGRLFRYAHERPDVLLVSRFLPGAPAEELLRRLVVEFPASKIVLMVGVLNGHAKAYMRLAEKYGLNDVITGKLPGDRPRTVFAVLEETEREGYILKPQEVFERTIIETDSKGQSCQFFKEDSYPAECSAFLKSRPENSAVGNMSGNDSCVLERREHRIINPVLTVRDLQSSRTACPSSSEGKVVVVVANKGGVGKTTVAIALSLALSHNGVKVCLCDFDLGGPNIGAFFNIKKKAGLETLAGKKEVERYLPELLVGVNRNLNVLPGVMDRSLPHIESWQLFRAVNYLAKKHDIVVCDTPPEFWTRPWLEQLFPRADMVLAVVDQSKFSEEETKNYTPKLVLMGVFPGKIRIVCNKYSAKLHSVKKVESAFVVGLKVKGTNVPRVVATIPEAWEDFVQKGYKGDIPGVTDVHSPWMKLTAAVADELGLSFGSLGTTRSPVRLVNLLNKFKKTH